MLTKRQKQIYDFVNRFLEANGFAPSFAEIANHFGLNSTATIHEHVTSLKKKGYLQSGKNEKRSLEVLPTKEGFAKALNLPLVGLIAAGEPIEAVEDSEMIAVPSDLVPSPGNSYVLRVKGESMKDEGILSGDYVIVERNPSPKNGDVVVALLDNTFATLKKFFREKNRIRLQPANSSMKPIFVKDPLIQGIVTGVIRNYKFSS